MTKTRITKAKQAQNDALQAMSGEWDPLFKAIDVAKKALFDAGDDCLAKNSSDTLDCIVLMTQDQQDLCSAASAAIRHLDGVQEVLNNSYKASWERQFGEAEVAGGKGTSTPAPAPEPEPGPTL
jgi:hypothetical protein